MYRRVLAIMLAGVLAFSNMGAALAAESSAGGETASEMTAAEEPEGAGQTVEAEVTEEPEVGTEEANSPESDAQEAFEEAQGAEAGEGEEAGASFDTAQEAALEEAGDVAAEEGSEEDGASEEASEDGASEEEGRQEEDAQPLEMQGEEETQTEGEETEVTEAAAEETGKEALADGPQYWIQIHEWESEGDLFDDGIWSCPLEVRGFEGTAYSLKASVTDHNGPEGESTEGVCWIEGDAGNERFCIDGRILKEKGITWVKVLAEGIVNNVTVDQSEREFGVRESREEYDREWDRTMLTGWDGTVNGSYNVHIENSENPWGHDEQYYVTDVEIVRDEPWEGESGDVIVDFHRDEDDENYWWYYRVGHHGEATLKVTYEDVHGQEQSYEFTLYVGGDVYRVHMDSEGGVRNAFPGGEIELYAGGSHEYYDENGNYHNDWQGLGYSWFIEEGEEYAQIEADGSSAVLKFKALPEGWDGIDEYVRVGVRVLDADGNETEGYDSSEFWVRSNYTEIWPLELDRYLDVGSKIENQAFEVRRYSYGEEGYEVLDELYDVEYEWHYDQNCLTVTEKRGGKETVISDGEMAQGNIFTFARKGNWHTDYSVRASWEDESGNWQDAWGNYQFWDRNYDFWYEIDNNDTIYSDGTRTYGFNLDNLQGVDFELVPEAGTGEWREGSGFENPIAEGDGWDYDPLSHAITFDGEKLSAAGIGRIETRISLQIGGVEVADEWRGFDVQEAQFDFWDLGDQVLFVDDEYYVSRNGRGFIRNTWLPDGQEVNYEITSLDYESDEDPFDTRDAVSVTEEEDGWKCRAVRGGEMQVSVQLRVDDGIWLRSYHSCETSFRLIVGGRRIYMNLFTETGSDRLQSGGQIRLRPDIGAEEYDWETGDRYPMELDGFDIRYEVRCHRIAQELVDTLYDGDFEAAAARGELWDYENGADGSILIKSISERAYDMELGVDAFLIDPDGEDCAHAYRSIFIDRVIFELRLIDENGAPYEWSETLPPGAEVKLTPQLMRDAKDGDYTPVQEHTDVTYRLNWYGGGGENDPAHIEVRDKDGNLMHSGDEITEADGPLTIKRIVDWDFTIGVDAEWVDDQGWNQGIGRELICRETSLSDGFTWNSDRGDSHYTWYYTNEAVDVTPDREKLDELAAQGYPVQTTVEIGGWDGEEIIPIIEYAIDADGHRGEALGEYDFGSMFDPQTGFKASGESLRQLHEVLRYQNDEWGSNWGRVNLRLHAELNGVTLVDYLFRITITQPYMELHDLSEEMGVGTQQVLKDGEMRLYLEDSDHDTGDYYEGGDYFDIKVTGVALKNAGDAQYLEIGQDGADWTLKALKVKDGPVPINVSFTGGPAGYDTYSGQILISEGVFDYEIRDASGEKSDYYDLLIGETEKVAAYVTYTEGGEVTEVPAAPGGKYYYTMSYDYYDDRMIEADDRTQEIRGLQQGSGELEFTISVYDENGEMLYQARPYVRIRVSASRARLSIPEDAVLHVKPGQSLTAQEILDMVGAKFTIYSMRKPEGEEYPIEYYGLEEIIGKEDELILSDGEAMNYQKLTVSAGATEGEAILIVFGVDGYGNRASAGVKVIVETSSKEEQVLTCDTSTPAVVNNKTMTYSVEGAKGMLTCEPADPSVATVTVSGDRILVKGLKAGSTKLIVRAAETDEYAAAEQEFDLAVITLGKTKRGDMFNLAGTVKVTWEAVPGAIWYKVYRSGKKDPVFVTKALIGYDNTEGMIPGEKYTYTIVASTTGKDENGNSIADGDSPSSYSKVMYRLKTVAWKYVKNTEPGKVLASYQKSPYGDSYVLLYADNEDMVGAKSKVIFGANTSSCTLGGFKKGKTYWFQIRVRKKVNGIDYYTTFGAKKKVVITK